MPGGGVYYMWRSCMLFVNITEIVHQARAGFDMDPVAFAVQCEKNGCDGIVLESGGDGDRMDPRGIRDIREAVQVPVNLRIPLEETDIEAARQVRPDKVILAPEKMDSSGWSDLKTAGHKIAESVRLFHRDEIPVSVLAAPDAITIGIVKHCGADFIQIHTADYANARGSREKDREIERIYAAADQVVKAGLKVSAGGGLTRDNLLPVLKTRALEELTVGSAVIARSDSIGLSKAIEEILDLVD
ncbi:MAG: pyridoxine 5'-phosphate synthase [Desulfotignum sp.]|nr:pyridoxine 5'-phosphate synthase [Desulfotignum sp.]